MRSIREGFPLLDVCNSHTPKQVSRSSLPASWLKEWELNGNDLVSSLFNPILRQGGTMKLKLILRKLILSILLWGGSHSNDCATYVTPVLAPPPPIIQNGAHRFRVHEHEEKASVAKVHSPHPRRTLLVRTGFWRHPQDIKRCPLRTELGPGLDTDRYVGNTR